MLENRFWKHLKAGLQPAFLLHIRVIISVKNIKPVQIMLKNACFLLFVNWFLLSAVFAQEQTDKSTAQLIDEYINTMAVSAVIARLDNVATVLQREPNSRLFVVINRYHSDLPGETVRALDWTKLYLTESRGVDTKRIILIDSGINYCPKSQIWLVPEGTTPKIEKSEYEQIFEDNDVPRKFDEYTLDLGKVYIDIGTGYGQTYVNSLKEFASEVKKNKSLTAYVIVYPQYETRYYRQVDAPSTTTKIFRSIRNNLINRYKLARTQFKIVNGGYRKLRQVELWILPRGVHPPVATPNAFPKTNRKRQK